MSYQSTQSFARVQLSAALSLASRYFSQVFGVQVIDDFEVFGWPLSAHLRVGRDDVLVFWSLGWWSRACFALLLAFAQVAIGVAFKAVWLLVIGLQFAVYAGRFDFDRYNAASAALEARRGEV